MKHVTKTVSHLQQYLNYLNVYLKTQETTTLVHHTYTEKLTCSVSLSKHLLRKKIRNMIPLNTCKIGFDITFQVCKLLS